MRGTVPGTKSRESRVLATRARETGRLVLGAVSRFTMPTSARRALRQPSIGFIATLGMLVFLIHRVQHCCPPCRREREHRGRRSCLWIRMQSLFQTLGISDWQIFHFAMPGEMKKSELAETLPDGLPPPGLSTLERPNPALGRNFGTPGPPPGRRTCATGKARPGRSPGTAP